MLRNPVRKSHFLPESEVGFRYWQKEEAERFVAFADAKYRDHNRHVLLVYTIALNTGMRWGEIAALKWDAVYLGDKPYLTVRRSYYSRSYQIREMTKGKTIRYVGINAALMKALKSAFENRNSDCDLVINTTVGEVLDNQNFVKRHFHPDTFAAKVSRIRFHDMRHTYASLFVMNGGNLFDLQKILAHQDVQTTMRYAHRVKEHVLSKANTVIVGTSANVIAANFAGRKSAGSGA